MLCAGEMSFRTSRREHDAPGGAAGLVGRCARSASARGWSDLAGSSPRRFVAPTHGRAACVVGPRTRWRRGGRERGGRAAGPAASARHPPRRRIGHPRRAARAPPYCLRAVTDARANVSAREGGSAVGAGIRGSKLFWDRGRGCGGRAVFARALVSAGTGREGRRGLERPRPIKAKAKEEEGIGHSGLGMGDGGWGGAPAPLRGARG
jgi:hypothetical protein